MLLMLSNKNTIKCWFSFKIFYWDIDSHERSEGKEDNEKEGEK
jgi:hypothetical protein